MVIGLTPIARMISDGAIVIARRRKSGIRRLMKPCITTWPANVPTLELERPGGEQRDREGQRRAAAEQRVEAGVGALDRVHVGQAGVVEELRGDDQHRDVDDARRGPSRAKTSRRWKRSSARRSAVFSRLDPRLEVSAECR